VVTRGKVIIKVFITLSSTPDLYLDELRLELQERCGVTVSTSTIWRTLIKGGYRMKKVRYMSFWLNNVALTDGTAFSYRNRAKC